MGYGSKLAGARGMTSMLNISVTTTCDLLATKIIRSISGRGVNVVRFQSSKLCLAEQGTRSFDLNVIDYSSQISGQDLCFEIPRQLPKSTPTIAIVSDTHQEQSVQLLNAGVDRCLPISFDENHFSAVARALTRRNHGLTSSLSEYGPLVFHHETKKTFIRGVEVELTSRESQVLEIVLKRIGQIISKETFIEEIGLDCFELSSSAIEVYIHRIRKKIPQEVLPIRNIKRCGYLLGRYAPTLARSDSEASPFEKHHPGLAMR